MRNEVKETNRNLLITRTDAEAYRQLLLNLKKYDLHICTKLLQTIHSNEGKYNDNLDLLRNELFKLLDDCSGINLHGFSCNSDEETLCISIYFDFDYIFYVLDLEVDAFDYICEFMRLISPICLPSNDLYFDYVRTRFICFEPGHISTTWANLVYDGRRCDKENCLYNYYGNCSYQKIYMKYPTFNLFGLCEEFMAKTK